MLLHTTKKAQLEQTTLILKAFMQRIHHILISDHSGDI